MQESRAQRDISVSKQRLTQSRSVGPLISDAVGGRFRKLYPDGVSASMRESNSEVAIERVPINTGPGNLAAAAAKRLSDHARTRTRRRRFPTALQIALAVQLNSAAGTSTLSK